MHNLFVVSFVVYCALINIGYINAHALDCALIGQQCKEANECCTGTCSDDNNLCENSNKLLDIAVQTSAKACIPRGSRCRSGDVCCDGYCNHYAAKCVS